MNTDTHGLARTSASMSKSMSKSMSREGTDGHALRRVNGRLAMLIRRRINCDRGRLENWIGPERALRMVAQLDRDIARLKEQECLRTATEQKELL